MNEKKLKVSIATLLDHMQIIMKEYSSDGRLSKETRVKVTKVCDIVASKSLGWKSIRFDAWLE